MIRWVDQKEILGEILKQAEKNKSVSVDLEFNSKFSYYETISLIQMSINDKIYVIDIMELGLTDELRFSYDNNFDAVVGAFYGMIGHKCPKCGYKNLDKLEYLEHFSCKCGGDLEKLLKSSFFGDVKFIGVKCKKCNKKWSREKYPEFHSDSRILNKGIKKELEKLGWDLSMLQTLCRYM